MSGSFDVPFDVLAFDQSRVRSLPSGGVESLAEQPDGVSPAVFRLRGKNRAPLR